MGGEEDVVRRMRAGQLQAATLSAAGLSSIDPAVGAIEKIPLLYHSLNEMEFVCSKMQTDLEQRLEQKGFVRRVRDTQDRRKVIVELNQARLAELMSVFGTLQGVFDGLLQGQRP